ncbi:MAG: hypothetical protein HKM06_04875 [Spirochaetales bacterium]|nr:hypothetical protein [Spirochaetales bacterium]
MKGFNGSWSTLLNTTTYNLNTLNCVFVLPGSSSAQVYVGTDKSIYDSSNNGSSWSPMQGSPIGSLALAVSGTTLYADGQLGASTSGLNVDSAGTWKNILNNSQFGNTTALVVDTILLPSATTILCGTNEGLAISVDSGATWCTFSSPATAGLGTNSIAGLWLQ